jgi:putative ATP-binding cassette transporter
MQRAVAQITAGRELYDRVVQMFRALTEGTKELKMHAARRGTFLAELETASRAHRRTMRQSDVTLSWLGTWTESLFFVAIGVLFLVTSRWIPVEPAVLGSYVLTVLMLRTPMETLNNTLPTLTTAAVALRKIDQLTGELAKRPSDLDGDGAPPPAAWSRLELRGVTHAYRGESGEGDFLLGPVDLDLTPGELVFIVGGNGSGKTTLAKLLLGIYAPEAGEIRVDGEPVTDATRDAYRQRFSAVFSDFFLFDALLGLEHPELDRRAAEYLRTLHLQHKVQVEGGRLSTTDLSAGQRKRLALLAAYLEDRPVYLFDEWAADQDPHFKEVFYLRLLPELKARGKTVLVISHDDRYYHVADRIVKLDEGTIRYDGDAAAFTAPRTFPVLAAPQPA